MATSPTATKRATIDDLLAVEGKAELINGEVVEYMGTGYLPNRIAGRTYQRLDAYAEATGRGIASTDNLVYAVPELASGRESFSPDAAYYDGPMPDDPLDVISGPPTFAVEVRSKRDRRRKSAADMAAKRLDYFEAGTLVVWDVDVDAEAIHSYHRDTPGTPRVFAVGDVADAEPALPGFRVAVADLFA